MFGHTTITIFLRFSGCCCLFPFDSSKKIESNNLEQNNDLRQKKLTKDDSGRNTNTIIGLFSVQNGARADNSEAQQSDLHDQCA